MNASAVLSVLNRTVAFSENGWPVRARVVDARTVYGRAQYRVVPELAPSAEPRWIDAARCSFVP